MSNPAYTTQDTEKAFCMDSVCFPCGDGCGETCIRSTVSMPCMFGICLEVTTIAIGCSVGVCATCGCCCTIWTETCQGCLAASFFKTLRWTCCCILPQDCIAEADEMKFRGK